MVLGRSLSVLVVCLTGLAGCSDDAPPIAGRPTFDDAGVDAGLDAAVGPADAATDAADAPPVPGDDCADPIDIRAAYEPAEDGAYHIAGNLDDFADDLDGCGLPNFDRDAVYRYVPPADGQIRTRLDDQAYADLLVGTSCGDPETGLSCAGYSGDACAQEPCGQVAAVTAGTPVYLVVDGLFTTVRAYVLSLQFFPWLDEGAACGPEDLAPACAPPMLCRGEADGAHRCREVVCGDGHVESAPPPGPAEECDDGNVVDGDGCSATCTFTQQGPGGEDCASATPLHLVPMSADLFDWHYASAVSDTSAASADRTGSCAESTTSPDDVWLVELDEATPLTVGVSSATEGYLPVLYVLAEDGGGDCGGGELGCAVAEAAGGAILTFDAIGPGRYWIVVDGVDGAETPAGGYTLEAVEAVY